MTRLIQQEDLTLETLAPGIAENLRLQQEASKGKLDLIASESRTSPGAMAAKHLAEGLDDRELALKIEVLAKERARKALDFTGTLNLEVQLRSPSGAVVNQRAFDMLSRGRRVRALVPDLTHGFGHLSHGGGRDGVNERALENPKAKKLFFAALEKIGRPVSPEISSTELAEFLLAYQAEDSAAYEAFFVTLNQEAIRTECPDLARIRRTGNPTATHRLHDLTTYSADAEGCLDFKDMARRIREANPAFEVVILGGSSNPNDLDYKTVVEAAHERGTLVWVDAAHFIGLVAGGAMRNPLEEGADLVTGTTHKSLQGVKGSFLVANLESLRANPSTAAQNLLAGLNDTHFEEPLDAATMAAHAATFKEVASQKNVEFASQVRENATALAEAFRKRGWKLVGKGTESHLVLLDVRGTFPVSEGEKPVTGRDVADLCTSVGLITNRNAIPGDQGTPMRPDGLRLGTVSLTARGAKEADMELIAQSIDTLVHRFRNPTGDHGRQLSPSVGRQVPSAFDPEVKKVGKELESMVRRLNSGNPLKDPEDLVKELAEADPELHALLNSTSERRIEALVRETLLRAQRALQGKYGEGAPAGEGGRYYEGCEHVDDLERMANANAMLLMGKRNTPGERRLGISVNCQAHTPDAALAAVAHGILRPGDVILVASNDTLPGGMQDRYRVLREPIRSSNPNQWREQLRQSDAKMVLISSAQFPLTPEAWTALREGVEEIGAILVVNNAGDLKRVLTAEIENPMQMEEVDLVITNTSGIGGPNRGAIVAWDERALSQKVAGGATLSGGPKFGIFPGSQGGPDFVTMVGQDVALRLAEARYKANEAGSAQEGREEPNYHGA